MSGPEFSRAGQRDGAFKGLCVRAVGHGRRVSRFSQSCIVRQRRISAGPSSCQMQEPVVSIAALAALTSDRSHSGPSA